MSKANRTIWRTVVFAGAMLGGGCGPKPAATNTTPQPSNTAPATDPAPAADPAAKPATDPAMVTPQAQQQQQTPPPPNNTANQDPCSGGEVTPPPPPPPRPRTNPDRPHGRGFVLS